MLTNTDTLKPSWNSLKKECIDTKCTAHSVSNYQCVRTESKNRSESNLSDCSHTMLEVCWPIRTHWHPAGNPSRRKAKCTAHSVSTQCVRTESENRSESNWSDCSHTMLEVCWPIRTHCHPAGIPQEGKHWYKMYGTLCEHLSVCTHLIQKQKWELLKPRYARGISPIQPETKLEVPQEGADTQCMADSVST